PYNQGSTWTAKSTGVERQLSIYRCPSDPTKLFVVTSGLNAATGSYALCQGSQGPDFGIDANMKLYNTGMFNYKIPTELSSVNDGTSNTFLVGEVQGADDTTLSISLWSQAARHES